MSRAVRCSLRPPAMWLLRYVVKLYNLRERSLLMLNHRQTVKLEPYFSHPKLMVFEYAMRSQSHFQLNKVGISHLLQMNPSNPWILSSF